MTITPSTMIPLGTTAPDFILPDTISGQVVSLSALKPENGLVIMFICNHCPFVKHIQSELVTFANDCQEKGIQCIAISANDAEDYPEDGPDKMKTVAKAAGYPFAYLYDESQAVAKAYQAACTPDFFLFDNHLQCVYRGRFDDSTPGNGKPITGADLRTAVGNLLAGQPIDPDQHPSQGCNIKWKE